MNRSIYLILLGIAFAFLTCAGPEQKKVLFPIDSLVSHQIRQLTEAKAKLRKETILDGKSNHHSYQPSDSSAWAKELDIFRQLEVLNKPVNIGSYLVDDNLYDPSSNLTVKAFSATEDDLPVESLRVYYQTSIQKPRKIEAVLRSETSLYESARAMTMEFQQLNNKTVLISYSVEGGQEILLGDTVTFTVKGNIQYR